MMTAFRIIDPFQTFFDLEGQLAVGGWLHFYEAGTTTDAPVYGDEDLSVNNGSQIDIGTDGRPVDDIWGDGTLSYRCRLYASDGTLIRDRDDIGVPGAGSLVIPGLVSGDFLTNDGSSLLWQAIRQMLDPTGQANKIIGSDGTNAIWIAKPANGTPGGDGTNANVTLLSAGAGGVKFNNGSGDLFCIQIGGSSAPATGAKDTQDTVNFPVAFKTGTTPRVFICPTVNASGGGALAIPTTYSKSATAFTVHFSTNDSNSDAAFVSALSYDWIAVGIVAS